MSVNAFKDTNQTYLPIRRDAALSVPSTKTPFITLGDEILVKGVWYKATTYSMAAGFGWEKLTSQSPSSTGSGIVWQSVTASQAMESGNGYILQNTSTPITLSLPTTSALGDVMWIVADLGCDGFTISQSASQQMVMSPTNATVSGVTGKYTVPSPAQSLVLQLICSVANSRWVVTSNYNGYVT